MSGKARGLGAAVAIGLAGYAAWMILSDDVADEASDAWVGEDGEPLDAREAAELERRRFAEAARTFDPRQLGTELPSEADDVPPPPLLDGPGAEVTPKTARVGFDYAMRRVEAVADKRTRLNQDQWKVMYREANDAYAALSIVLDAGDEAERAELEEAHKRLKEGLRRVRVRGRKFGP